MTAPASPTRASVIMVRGRLPLRIAIPVMSIMTVAVPLALGLIIVAIGGVFAVVTLVAAVRAIGHEENDFRLSFHLLNAIALLLVGYAVLVIGVAPVIAVYFPVMMVLSTGYIMGARPALFWGLLSLVLVVVCTLAPLPEPQDAGTIPTLVIRVGTVGSVLIFAVWTRREHDRQARELDRVARVDSLTGLANRMEFDRAIAVALARSARNATTGALVFIDLDGMKAVNDTLGHATGDAYLQEVARRMLSVTRSIDTPARLGGDEFVILLPEINNAASSTAYAERLMEVVSAPWIADGTDIRPRASIGVATFTGQSDTADQLLSRADQAMYEAKRAGGGQIINVADILREPFLDL